MGKTQTNPILEDDPKIKRAWDEAQQAIKKAQEEFAVSIKAIKDSYDNRQKDYIELTKMATESSKTSTDFQKFMRGETYADKAESINYYEQQRQGIMSSNLSKNQKAVGLGFIGDDQYSSNNSNQTKGLYENTMNKVGDEMSDELQKVLLGYQDFSEGMKAVGTNMSKYMLNQLSDTLMQMIFTQQNASAMKSGFSSLLGLAGGWAGAAGGFISNLFKRHSGGMIPVGANAELPGTEEQLALLKGGERILSPAENTSYNNDGGGGSSPVVFNNFNVKAWDSKDVQKYLLENKHLINSITYEGIKNNNNHLRNIVQNA